MTVQDQARVFLAMMLCGAASGAAYDLLGLLRRGAMMTDAADLLLGIFAAACVILTALRLSCDPFRLFVFAAVLCGAALYSFTIGTIVRFLTGVLRGIAKKGKV